LKARLGKSLSKRTARDKISDRKDMTDLGNNLNWIVGSIAGGIVAFLSWFYRSTLLSAIVGVLIGAGIAYVVQTRTQKNAWKREYSVKIAETVYGNLYSEVKGILSSLEKGTFYSISFGKWREFQNDHRHLMVKEPFREQLDKFLKNVDEYGSNLTRLHAEVFPSIVKEATKEIFGLTANTVSIQMKFKTASGFSSTSLDLFSCLARRGHPRELVKESYPRSEILSVEPLLENIQEKVGRIEPVDEAKFDELWKLCIEKEENNETYRLALQQQSQLLEESKRIFEELTKRIEEPWRI
jgi:hypothetical protein